MIDYKEELPWGQAFIDLLDDAVDSDLIQLWGSHRPASPDQPWEVVVMGRGVREMQRFYKREDLLDYLSRRFEKELHDPEWAETLRQKLKAAKDLLNTPTD